MAYDLSEVAEFCLQFDTDILDIEQTWAAHREALETSSYELNLPTNLTYFMSVLKYSVWYLLTQQKQGTLISVEQQEAIDTHYRSLLAHYKKAFPEKSLTPLAEIPHAPLPEFLDRTDSNESTSSSESEVSTESTESDDSNDSTSDFKTTKAKKFLESAEFVALKTYLSETLTHDSRNHSFFCMDLRVNNKALVLRELIEQLESKVDITGMVTTLDEFYRGKGCKIVSEDGTSIDSPYETLNKGQNITTRMFSRFGMRTTTITLLDDLRASLDIENKLIASPSSNF